MGIPTVQGLLCRDPGPFQVVDNQSLLLLHDGPGIEERPFEKVRIFNAYKNRSMDRQIGDRRGRNAIEQKVIGPSMALPTGPLLTDLFLNARRQTLRVSISDREDFYHQIQCTPSKSQCNTIGVLEEKDLEGLRAFDDFKQNYQSKYVRSSHGARATMSGQSGLPAKA